MKERTLEHIMNGLKQILLYFCLQKPFFVCVLEKRSALEKYVSTFMVESAMRE